MKGSRCQHNKLSPSWNVFLCTPPLLLFCWPTVTLAYRIYPFIHSSEHRAHCLLLEELGGSEMGEEGTSDAEAWDGCCSCYGNDENKPPIQELSFKNKKVNWMICCSGSKCAIIRKYVLDGATVAQAVLLRTDTGQKVTSLIHVVNNGDIKAERKGPFILHSNLHSFRRFHVCSNLHSENKIYMEKEQS